MLENGALMCDIREVGEYAGGHVQGAKNMPLSALDQTAPDADGPIIFCCLSGARTAMAAGQLANKAGREAYVLEGGLKAWARAGLPLARG